MPLFAIWLVYLPVRGTFIPMYDKSNNKKAATCTAMWAALAVLTSTLATGVAHAQRHTVTPAQQATAQQVSEQGIPLSELAPNAPDNYTVKRGDTLWGISRLYLRSPWRWPELWGMNIQEISNPHLIYPGQILYLDKDGTHARLRMGARTGNETVRLSPRTRAENYSGAALPTLQPHLIEPFLVQPLVVDDQTVQQAPRVVAAREGRVILGNGDRVFVRGAPGEPLEMEPGVARNYRIFRNTVPLKDPVTDAILGWEAQYVGRARLVTGETSVTTTTNGKDSQVEVIPAAVDLSGVKEEVRVGDRLLPAPERHFINYVPHAPAGEVEARVVSIYGGAAVTNAAQNHVLAINLGTDDGMEAGHVLKLLTNEEVVRDKTEEGGGAMIRLPAEINGLAMVFLTFERVSYALVLDVQRPVVVGDRLVNP